MKSNLYSIEGEKVKKIELPEVFNTAPREDLIRKAFRAVTLSLRSPYGSSPRAGMRRVGHNSGPGRGVSRIPRTSGSSRGVILASMVGGKSAHSPRTTKILTKKINEKERKLARMSALAMTASNEAVSRRGHRIPEGITLPVIVEDAAAKITKTKDVENFLESVGLLDDLIRAKEGKKVRAGRGTMRGRRYKQPKSILFVSTSADSLKAYRSLPGVEVATPDSLSIRKLAPGGQAGRLVVFTESALKQVGKGVQ
ncbi:50S ribosomal protein L4 [uncultured archaeon]|nr:50S ribosomal protein L4 [uncultured archaeon]